jgi:hypothetical protein
MRTKPTAPASFGHLSACPRHPINAATTTIRLAVVVTSRSPQGSRIAAAVRIRRALAGTLMHAGEPRPFSLRSVQSNAQRPRLDPAQSGTMRSSRSDLIRSNGLESQSARSGTLQSEHAACQPQDRPVLNLI